MFQIVIIASLLAFANAGLLLGGGGLGYGLGGGLGYGGIGIAAGGIGNGYGGGYARAVDYYVSIIINSRLNMH